MTNFENFKACLNNMSDKEINAVCSALLALKEDVAKPGELSETADVLDKASFYAIFETI